jgi:hypothetical protein
MRKAIPIENQVRRVMRAVYLDSEPRIAVLDYNGEVVTMEPRKQSALKIMERERERVVGYYTRAVRPDQVEEDILFVRQQLGFVEFLPPASIPMSDTDQQVKELLDAIELAGGEKHE